ncbi:Crp/Fnr family transcriptional regulator [Chryseobacterium indologenes]|uniref:Crp/Fnr family transcriptional regulator n=1 Tax=Chryseobacterium indologenes TaxID=253 RepID=A0AAD0YQE8_CHRID|nr:MULTISPECIES: Crp/Fnr family transcriptional regulator [Chryseobacterium]AZB16410.1 Crp/Fnr family transcriptional regulator [Chryseobacterium indologenes]QPQ50902.1 Crp/Fnr family transcriptional regulator [Chryseobacterium indologenes]SFJ12818.1 cAMP-binding domain of CRP or a regulatory subunit of cAMP-dependent protein kinases [Chryseobacterium indologenes]SUX49221.1 fumarate/nitrate reduction transcriptional regulator [Chryseobacterium indologenes]VFA40167.1 fumarate/nitrate reduction 
MKENALLKNISRYITLTEEEVEIFKSFWTEKTLEKGEYLLRNGNVCRYDNYVVSGLLKAFYINAENGNEEILYFSIDDWWASDIDSFSKQRVSVYNIQALEKTTVLQISYHSFQKLLLRIPRLERYFRLILEGYLGVLQKRIIYNNIYDAEYRYFDFLKKYPDIAARVPQYLIASYLGVSAELISRLRKKNKSS